MIPNPSRKIISHTDAPTARSSLLRSRSPQQGQDVSQVVGGGMVVVDKIDLEKYPTLYNATQDITGWQWATADEYHNVTNPSDTARFRLYNAWLYGFRP